MRENCIISTTPIILSLFAEKKRVAHKEITKFVYNVSSDLHTKNVFVDAVFRGHLKNPDKGIQSETVDAELSYWLANNFIKESFDPSYDDICLEINNDKSESFSNYTCEKLSANLSEIKWASEDCRLGFLEILTKKIDEMKDPISIEK